MSSGNRMRNDLPALVEQAITGTQGMQSLLPGAKAS